MLSQDSLSWAETRSLHLAGGTAEEPAEKQMRLPQHLQWLKPDINGVNLFGTSKLVP
jgi:hypothetical protein